jgi:hypothetical protein
MQLLRKPLLVAAAATALIGGAALAASNYTHHMSVRLPDGSIAQVDYVGDVAPRVVLQPVATDAAADAADPFMAVGFPGFGQMDRIFADMQRQQAAMMQQVAAMEHDVAIHGPAAIATGAGPGMANWSYVSSTTSSNGCTQTVEWTSQGDATKTTAAQPQVVRTSAGNCDKAVKDTPIHTVADVKPATPEPAGKTI